jgi:glycosyltransferase involved in cell wall biosynthesis
MNIGIDAKRIFFNNSGLGNYGRRFYLALAKNLTGDKFYLYSPKTVGGSNPYQNEMIRENSIVVEPDKKIQKILGGALWRSGFIREQLLNDHINIYYGLSNEIPIGLKKTDFFKVVVIHDLIFLRYPEMYPKFDAFFYKKKTEYASCNSDHIIAASEQTKRDIIDFYKIDPGKISVLYPCTASIFHQEKADDSTGFFKPAREYIISIGAITPRKNLLQTVRAVDLVNGKHDLDLVVIGTAAGLGRKYLETIKDYIENHNLTDRVHFLGNVPYHLVPDLCRKAKMMIYPSRFEGFGMPIVEGLFSKIPVITSQGGCFPEAGGNGAVYIDPDIPEEIADWIDKIMTSQELSNGLITKGLQYAQKFRQENIENDILNFHNSLPINP